jgi:membrane protein
LKAVEKRSILNCGFGIKQSDLVGIKEKVAMLSRIINFLKTDIWRIRLKNYPRSKSFFLRQLRIIVLAIRGFDEDKCRFRASALTFYSLLSIVPVIAMIFGIAKGFGLEERVKAEIMLKMQTEEQVKVAERIINFANSLLAEVSGGIIAGIGVAFLFWAIIKVLSNIENSFNDIWGVKTPRNISRKFSDYLSVMLVCPFLLVMSGSITVAVSSQIRDIAGKIAIFRAALGPLIFVLLKLLPYCTIWIAFTFVLIFMPNTKVKLKYGLLAGVIAGTIFQIVQWVYINFQIGVAKYGAIYGSFAALPLFLLWLQISWLVVLFGAELSFAYQNVETYEFEPDCLSVSYSFKKLLSLLITHLLVKNFCQGEQPWGADQVSRKLDIPIRLVRQILYELVESGVISEVGKKENKEVAYQPACDVEKLTVKYVVDSLEQRGNAAIPVTKSSEFEKLSDCLNKFGSAIEKLPENLSLKNI